MSDKPIRVQLSREKGWRMPPNTVKVDRATGYGNPFVVGEFPALTYWAYCNDRVETPEQAVSLFRSLLIKQAAVHDSTVDMIVELRGKNLACWCALNQPCHADVLLEFANRPVCDAPNSAEKSE